MTGFSRTISAAEVCFSTGFVSLIGWGEAGLELGAWDWDPEKKREKAKEGRNVKRDGWSKEQTDRKTKGQQHTSGLFSCSTVSTYRKGLWSNFLGFALADNIFCLSAEIVCFWLFFFFFFTCWSWLFQVKRVWIGDRSKPSPHFFLIPLSETQRTRFYKHSILLTKSLVKQIERCNQVWKMHQYSDADHSCHNSSL